MEPVTYIYVTTLHKVSVFVEARTHAQYSGSDITSSVLLANQMSAAKYNP